MWCRNIFLISQNIMTSSNEGSVTCRVTRRNSSPYILLSRLISIKMTLGGAVWCDSGHNRYYPAHLVQDMAVFSLKSLLVPLCPGLTTQGSGGYDRRRGEGKRLAAPSRQAARPCPGHRCFGWPTRSDRSWDWYDGPGGGRPRRDHRGEGGAGSLHGARPSRRPPGHQRSAVHRQHQRVSCAEEGVHQVVPHPEALRGGVVDRPASGP
ncbi:hypothetical protein J8273_5844 [Carpediemonas membranifera]|uniref:Uncharacterized protein n=1 Tax=Carpediemonas membranifera TaxID=201153 RepID=A0A8J6ARW7_9EUKA|nr:hypothetical protein J8273_5844 [Carpediemonas membranifera]|eukprot:KAG9392806.1 hypothetical protein J8273_5844 [Carpediemonas membranifera]